MSSFKDQWTGFHRKIHLCVAYKCIRIQIVQILSEALKQSLEVFIMLLYCLLVLTMSDAWRRPHDPLWPHHHHHLHHHHHHLLHHHFYLLHHSNPQTHNSMYIQRWELWKMCQLVVVVSSWVNTWRGQSTEYWVHVPISDKIHLKIHCLLASFVTSFSQPVRLPELCVVRWCIGNQAISWFKKLLWLMASWTFSSSWYFWWQRHHLPPQ